MPNICIPKEISQKLLKGVKSGEFTVQSLTEMTSKERNTLFQKYADKGTAQQVNGLFEKALVSKQKVALKRWVETVFGVKEKESARYKNVMRKINELNETGVLNPKEADSFFTDLVAEQLGVTVTAEEAKNISEKAENLEKLANEKPDNEFGLPNLDYLKARKEMFDYLNSLAPSSRLKILSSTVARGNMLFSIKSPTTNILGNTVMGIQQALERRLSSKQWRGSNPEAVKEYFKRANKIFKETGYDITRMLHLDDTQKTLGEENLSSQGEGKVRKVGRFYEDFVFKKLMVTPDVAFSAAHFGDSANMASTRIAEQEGLKGEAAKKRALEIFKDATSLDPQTDEGMAVRAQAIADASYATYQNDSYYSTLSLGIRKILNAASGDLRVGDQLMPFVKTPANVIGAGLDASGISAFRGLYNLKSALEKAKTGDRSALRDVVRDFVRSGLGISLAVIISSMFDPDDFIGEYPTNANERELLRLRRATPNSIRIGDKWISLDYFGAIAAPLVGMMYAKKYGNGLADTAYQYWKGVGTQSLKIVGLNELNDIRQTIVDATKDDGGKKTADEKFKEVGTSITVSAADFLSARVVPAFIYDVGKATDDYERKADYNSPTQKLTSKLPFTRENLPIRKDVFGDAVKTESALSTFFFGSSLKTDNNSPLISELVRLQGAGHLPAITDVENTSSRVKQFKAQVSAEKYDKMLKKYQTTFKSDIESLIKSGSYKRADDEKKSSMINSTKADALDRALTMYGYRKPRKTK